MDLSHLGALELRASHERERLRVATRPRGVALRRVWVAQCEREITAEREFLGLAPESVDGPEMSVDALLAELLD